MTRNLKQRMTTDNNGNSKAGDFRDYCMEFSANLVRKCAVINY